MGKLLGKGAFGAVNYCEHRVSGQARAVKCFEKRDMSEDDRQSLLRESKTL